MSTSVSGKEVVELLPFFVNGTLDGAQKAVVSAAVASDKGLKAEVEALGAIRKTVQSSDDLAQSPGELGLKRLLAEIEKTEDKGPGHWQGQPANTNAAPLWNRLGGYAVAACLGALAVFVTLGPANQDDYAVTASGEVAVTDPEMTMAVSFSEGAALAMVSAVLRDQGLVIVDGPSARGVYLLADQEGGVLTIDQAEKLRSQVALFATVDDPS